MSGTGAAPTSAKAAITSLCRVLALQGITSLDPETLRQAKFDGPVAPRLWRALHDLVVLQLVGCVGTSALAAGPALQRLWHDVEEEHLDLATSFPAEGRAFVCHQLLQWGCPTQLVVTLTQLDRALDAVDGSSSGGAFDSDGSGSEGGARQLLLALGWLVAAARLFEAALLHVDLTAQELVLLPPYPQDTCLEAAAVEGYVRAAAQARGQVRAMVAHTDGVPSDWGAVEAAAQAALMLYGKARLRLLSLQSLADARCRLQQRLLQAQPGGAAPASQAGPPTLTAYELHLLRHPRLLNQHVQAAVNAAACLAEQQQLAASGRLFFQWMGSVLEEQRRADHRDGVAVQLPSDGTATAGAETPADGSIGSSALPGGVPPSALQSTLQQLPACSTPRAQQLLQRLGAELGPLERAVAPRLSAAANPAPDRLAMYARPTPAQQRAAAAATAAAAAAPHVSLHLFQCVAEQALATSSSAAASGQPASGDTSAAAAVWKLPADIQAAVLAAQSRQRQDASSQDGAAAAALWQRRGSLTRHVVVPPPAPGSRGSASAVAAAALLAAPPDAGLEAAGGVTVQTETDRVLAASRAVAKPLAKVRANHCAALMAAMQGAGGTQLIIKGL